MDNSFLRWPGYGGQAIPRWWVTTSHSPLQDPTSVSCPSLKIHSVSKPLVSLILTQKALSKMCSMDITISKSTLIPQFRNQLMTTFLSWRWPPVHGLPSVRASGRSVKSSPSPCMLLPPMPGRRWGCGGTSGLWWGDAMLERWGGDWPTETVQTYSTIRALSSF